MHGGADALVGAAAADVAAQRRVDVGIGRIGLCGEQRGGGHDLARLAVAALHHVQLGPGALHRVAAVGRQSFDGGDLLARDGRHRRDAGTAGRPSTCTVQAPHWAMPQPNLVPVRPSRSRSTQSRGMSAGAFTSRSAPLTVSFMALSSRGLRTIAWGATLRNRKECVKRAAGGMRRAHTCSSA